MFAHTNTVNWTHLDAFYELNHKVSVLIIIFIERQNTVR